MGGQYAAAVGHALASRTRRVAIIAGVLPLTEPRVFAGLPAFDRYYTRWSQHSPMLARACFGAARFNGVAAGCGHLFGVGDARGVNQQVNVYGWAQTGLRVITAQHQRRTFQWQRANARVRQCRAQTFGFMRVGQMARRPGLTALFEHLLCGIRQKSKAIALREIEAQQRREVKRFGAGDQCAPINVVLAELA